MSKFSFEDWSFEYGDGDGTLGSNLMFLKDVIDESDIHFIRGVSKPILKRSAITKIMNKLQFEELDFTPTISGNSGNHEFMIVVKIVMRDNKKEKLFIGNGEASYLNTKGDISENYPFAMAIKRARSRAIIDYLGIDAYGEEESTSFKKVEESDIPDDVVEFIGTKWSRQELITNIKELSKNRENPMTNVELVETIKFILRIKEDATLKVQDLSNLDLLQIIVCLNIEKILGADSMNEYINRKY